MSDQNRHMADCDMSDFSGSARVKRGGKRILQLFFFRCMTYLLSRFFDPESANRLTITALQRGLVAFRSGQSDPECLRVDLWGLPFPNPVGLAAGFDKNGRIPNQLLEAGFGFVEVGTVTPDPQVGSPRPRVFRLHADQAIINRMGFCNDGYHVVYDRLKTCPLRGISGVNIGAGKESADVVGDYVAGIAHFADLARYFTINISSPNTPGLRDWHMHDRLDRLLKNVLETRDDRAPGKAVLLKIAPDLSDDELKKIIDLAQSRNVDGLIISNTTISRPDDLQDKAKKMEAGGLSGRPLFSMSTRMLARAYLYSKGTLPLVGVGGVVDGKTAYQKILAGASLLQLYTGLCYHGPELIDVIKRELIASLHKDGFSHISEAVGCEAEKWSD